MAKRRKKHSRRRSRRVGAFKFGGKGTGLKLAALAGGFFLGNTINGQIDKLLTSASGSTTTTTTTTTPSSMGTIATVGEIGIGGLLLMRRQSAGTMGMVLTVGGGLLAGAGIRRALKSMGIMSGYQSVPVIGRHRMAGYQNVPVIGNRVTPPQLAGTPAQLQGFRVNGYTPTGSGVMGAVGSIGGSGITNTGGGGLMG